MADFLRGRLIKCTTHCARPLRHFLLKLKCTVVTRCEFNAFFQFSLIESIEPKRGKLNIEASCSLLQYTQKNLEFALTLEPKNEALLKKMKWVMQQRKQKLATVPSTIGDELEFNPFMRVDLKPLQVRCSGSNI